MREKSDESKLLEGRGSIFPEGYVGWKQANEAKSTGTAALIHDPISGRSVSVLSQAEKTIFWILRFTPKIHEIYDQWPLQKEGVAEICRQLGVRSYSRILSTDFLVQKKDGSFAAISVKGNRKMFDKDSPGYNKLIIRQTVEKKYWEARNVPFAILFGDEADFVFANNIKEVMRYWPEHMAIGNIGKLKYLIAHRAIDIDLHRPRIPFAKIAEEMPVEMIYEDYRNENGTNIY